MWFIYSSCLPFPVLPHSSLLRSPPCPSLPAGASSPPRSFALDCPPNNFQVIIVNCSLAWATFLDSIPAPTFPQNFSLPSFSSKVQQVNELNTLRHICADLLWLSLRPIWPSLSCRPSDAQQCPIVTVLSSACARLTSTHAAITFNSHFI